VPEANAAPGCCAADWKGGNGTTKMPLAFSLTNHSQSQIAFAATDGMTDLKLIAAGITTDKIASRSIFLTPLQIVLPWLLGKQTAGPKPLNVFLWAYPYRILMSLAFALLVFWTPSFRESNGEYPYFYYGIWIAAYYMQQVIDK
jgi:MFS transporter, PAT family, solute carrier family 33 (acetyl-CoA transportor), member 1